MSAEILRRAAALMRERATEALGPDYEWAVDTDADDTRTWWAFTDEDHMCANGILTVREMPQWTDRVTLFDHIVGWTPALAVALANWLDDTLTFAEREAEALGMPHLRDAVDPYAVAVARAYLGESA